MATPSPKTLGQLVAKYRHRLHLTQEELAERSDLSTRTIEDIERGKVRAPHTGSVQRLVAALELSSVERAEIEVIVAEAASQQRTGMTSSSAPSSAEVPKAQANGVATVLPRFTFLRTRKLGIIFGGVFGGIVIALALLVFLPKEPSCPPPNREGVTLYELPCYQGRSLTLTESDLDLCDNPLDPAHGKVAPCFSAPSWNDVASSMWVGPGYRVELHLHSPELADDSMLSFGCNTAISDFGKLHFPNGNSVDNNVSRVVIQKTDCRYSIPK